MSERKRKEGKWQMDHCRAAGAGRGGLREQWARRKTERESRSAERRRQDAARRAPPPPWGRWRWEVLTADLGAQLVLPDGVQLLVLLLRQLQPLLLHLVDLLLSTQGLLGHHQVILQHVLLLPPPLYPGVLNLSGFWNRPQRF